MATRFEDANARYQRNAYPVAILLPGTSVKFVFAAPSGKALDIFWAKIKIGVGGSWQSLAFGGNTDYQFDGLDDDWVESDAVAALANQSSPLPVYVMGSYGVGVGDVMPFNRILTPNTNAHYPTMGFDRMESGASPYADTSDPTDIPIAENPLVGGTTNFKAYGPVMVIADVDDAIAHRSVGIIRDSRGGSVFNVWDGEVGITTRLRREGIPYAQASRGGSNGTVYIASQASPYVQYIESKFGTVEIGYGINSYAGLGENAAQGDTVHGDNVTIADNIRSRVGIYANPTCQIVLSTIYPNTAGSTSENTFTASYNYAGWQRQNERVREADATEVPGLVAINDDEAVLGNGQGGYNLTCVPLGYESQIYGDGIHCGGLGEFKRQAVWDIQTVFGVAPVIGPQVFSAWCEADGRRLFLGIAARANRSADLTTFNTGLPSLPATDEAAITLPDAGNTTVDEGYVRDADSVFVGFPIAKILEGFFPFTNIAPVFDAETVLRDAIDDLSCAILPDSQARVLNDSEASGETGGADSTPPALVAGDSFLSETGRYVLLVTDEAQSQPLAPPGVLTTSQRNRWRVTADGNRRALTRGRTVASDSLLLLLTNPLGTGKTVEAQYLGGGGIEDAAGNDLAAFGATEITNDSTVADAGDESGGMARVGSPFVGSKFAECRFGMGSVA